MKHTYPKGIHGTELIDLERRRQIKQLKHRKDHLNDKQQLLDLAILVAQEVLTNEDETWVLSEAEHICTKYKDDPIKLLTIAGALIAAEIDRMLNNG